MATASFRQRRRGTNDLLVSDVIGTNELQVWLSPNISWSASGHAERACSEKESTKSRGPPALDNQIFHLFVGQGPAHLALSFFLRNRHIGLLFSESLSHS